MTEVGPHMNTDAHRDKKCSLLHAKLKEAKSNTEREFVSTSEIMSNSFHMDASDNIHINGSQTEHV